MNIKLSCFSPSINTSKCSFFLLPLHSVEAVVCKTFNTLSLHRVDELTIVLLGILWLWWCSPPSWNYSVHWFLSVFLLFLEPFILSSSYWRQTPTFWFPKITSLLLFSLHTVPEVLCHFHGLNYHLSINLCL